MGVFRPLPLLKVADALPGPPPVRQFSKFGSPATAPHVLRGVQSSGYSPMRFHLSKSYTMSAAHISGAVCISASKPCSHPQSTVFPPLETARPPCSGVLLPQCDQHFGLSSSWELRCWTATVRFHSLGCGTVGFRMREDPNPQRPNPQGTASEQP